MAQIRAPRDQNRNALRKPGAVFRFWHEWASAASARSIAPGIRRCDREVALKLLLPGALSADEESTRMLREARAIARSGIRTSSQSTASTATTDGLASGRLHHVARRCRNWSRPRAPSAPAKRRSSASMSAAPLAPSMRAGFLHRDIKAENVMREEGGRILLMDFGLSGLANAPGQPLRYTQLHGPRAFSGVRPAASPRTSMPWACFSISY